MDENIKRDLVASCAHLAQQIIDANELIEETASLRKLRSRKEALEALLSLKDQHHDIPHLTFDHLLDLLWQLYDSSPALSKIRKRVAQTLVEFAQRRDIPFGDAVEAAHTLYLMSPKGSEERQQAIQMLLDQAQWPDITMKESVEAICALCYASPLRSREKIQAVQILSDLASRPDLSIEDTLTFITLDSEHMTIIGCNPTWEKRQTELRYQLLIDLASRSDLTPEQSTLVLDTLSWLQKSR